MLITPLKVFASVRQRPTESSSHTQMLSLKRQPSPYSTLIVLDKSNDQSTKSTTESEHQFTYTDCQYTTSSKHLVYAEQMEQLVSSTMEGYNSAGMFINSRDTRFDGIRTTMMKTAMNLLQHQLTNENSLRRNNDQPEIKLTYGYIGFCDDCCMNYRTGGYIPNSDAVKSAISNMVEPIDSMDDVLDSILSIPHRLPSLLIFHLSDGNQFDSTFAWIDAHPPISDYDLMHYGKSYSEFESLTRELCLPHLPSAPLVYQYSMSHMLLDYFSGSYQTMVFAHFEEYGRYTSGLDLDVLIYSSQLQFKRCCVTRGRLNNIQGALVNDYLVSELQHQIAKQGLLIKKYKSATASVNHEPLHRDATEDNVDYLTTRLVTTKNSAHAAMERQKATANIQIADIMHQINDMKIELVEARMVARSFQHTADELESHANGLQRVNEELYQRRDADALRMKELEARNKLLMAKLKGTSDGDLTNMAELEWLGNEGQYIQEIHELKSEKDRLNRDVGALTLERKQMISRLDSLRLEKDSTISRLQRLHDKEMKSLEESLQQQLEQTIAEKDNEVATMKDDLEFIRSQLQATLLESPNVEQQQTQIRRSSPPPPLPPPEWKAESKTPKQPKSSSSQNQTHPNTIVHIDSPSPTSSLEPKPINLLEPAQPQIPTSSATPLDQVSPQQPNNKRRKLDHVEVYELD